MENEGAAPSVLWFIFMLLIRDFDLFDPELVAAGGDCFVLSEQFDLVAEEAAIFGVVFADDGEDVGSGLGGDGYCFFEQLALFEFYLADKRDWFFGKLLSGQLPGDVEALSKDGFLFVWIGCIDDDAC